MKKILGLLALLTLTVTTGCTTSGSNFGNITDDAGNKVTITEVPENVAIVGLPPMVSFYLEFVGDVDRLGLIPAGPIVTSTTYGDRLYDLSDVPTTGWMGFYDVESVLAAEPDLIITSTGTDEYDLLVKSGIPTVGFTWGEDLISEARRWTTQLGLIFDLEEKAEKVNAVSLEIEGLVEEKLKNTTKTQTGLILPWYSGFGDLEVSSDFYAGGYWLDKLKLTNSAAHFDQLYSATMEDIYTMDPDFIFLTVTAYNPSDIINNTAYSTHNWSVVSAAQNGNVFAFPQGLFSSYALSTAAPLALLLMADCVYDLDLNLETYAKKHFDVLGMELTTAEITSYVTQK
ncbi:MAG: ABC transporter substrate-binding protein [bacterium]